MALCLLPTDKISSLVPILESNCIKSVPKEDQKQVKAFVKYFKNTWMKRVKPKHFSVFELRRKTNNDSKNSD